MLSFIQRFIRTESAAGMVMILFAVLAFAMVNSPLSSGYEYFIHFPLTVGSGAHALTEPLHGWVADVLMVFFFLVVGMELKREMKEGFLAERAQIALPLFAALAGMAVPALIFLAFNHSYPANFVGWAIPSATDIAFALCVLLLVGKNIPPAAKIFLLAVAIFDDLGAILIIAAFYSSSLELVPLALAVAGFGALALLNWRQVASITPYMLVGVFLWLCLHHGGVHTTIAGVAVGMAIPMRGKRKGTTPLNDFMHGIHPWVSFGVLPLFAFTSSGVSLAGIVPADVLAPLPLGIALGLFFGKQIGIFGTVWLLDTLHLVRKPAEVSWMQLYGISILAGIGFTMSLFIGLLAFSDSAMQELVKIGVIGGSLLSTVWGFVVLRYLAAR